MILSTTSQIGHHHKVTNITLSQTSLTPTFSLHQKSKLGFFTENA